MELRERLKAMGVRPRVPGGTPPGMPEGQQAAPETPQAAESSLLSAPAPLSRQRLKIEHALSGTWHDTVEGPCFVFERRYPVSHPRGPIMLGSVLHSRPNVLWEAGRALSLRDMDARKLLFLDTETTGLSGGTGTYVFLVGAGFFSEDGQEVVIRQYFLTDVSAERALLHALNDLFANFSAVVTFNGKSFDWPLLETRFTYSRVRCILRDPPHLDMLGPSRRLWKDRLPSCSLDTLEQLVLGFNRGFDVPGWRIPSLYFQYLRAGHAGHILPVFEHNEHDLLTLVALTGHVGRILDSPDEADLQAAEWFGLGKLYEDLGRYTDSLRAYSKGLDFDPSPELRGVALRRLSFLYKYLQQQEEAVAIWNRLAAEGTHLMFPYLELAKHYEHHVKDYAAAAEYTLLAQVRATNAVERAELQHRLDRVASKARRLAEREAAKPAISQTQP
ncbi:MAG TPA: ribonuclease H-like domain-containing protein, partial [Chloroflexia bacterium]|nr:ribonuclease H-like domain-containing protein [Chloroflexia bacterium]